MDGLNNLKRNKIMNHTEDRKKLIAKFQKWLDTNPRKELIASQCANIAEEYHTEQSILSEVSRTFKEKQIPTFDEWIKEKKKEDKDIYEYIYDELMHLHLLYEYKEKFNLLP